MASKIESSGYEPVNCLVSSGKRVAIIVPFRDDGSKGNQGPQGLRITIKSNAGLKSYLTLERFNHLKLLLRHMIPILIRQNIKFKFFLITQTPNERFNRGKLLNAGFEEVTKRKVRAPWTTAFQPFDKKLNAKPLINNLIVLYFTMLT